MLEQLCLKDKYWRKVAYNICKDHIIADDLVQDMYLKVYSLDKDKVITDWFIAILMRNNFIDKYRRDKKYISLNDFDKPITEDTFEFDYKSKETIKEEETVKELKWWEAELITMTHDKSFHEIQRETNLNYQFVRRTLIKAKENGKTKKAS